MAKQVEWTLGAQYDRKDIFEYWNNRNKSNLYSKKLYALFKKSIKIISKHPKIGRSFGRDNIRVTVVKDYLIVYKETDNCIQILSIWDSRQDPDRLEKRL
jgi:addiction module RelE/StbE family toxin